MKEFPPDDAARSAPMLDDVLAIPDHLRDALWRVESARLEPAESAGLAGLRHGRLGDRRRPRRRRARRSPQPAAGHRARLRAAELGRRGLDRALLELLGRDRGDARLLRGGDRASAPAGSSSAPAARSSTGPARRGSRSSACRASCSRARPSPTWSSRRSRPRPCAGAAPRIAAEIEDAAAMLARAAETSSRPARRRSPARLEGSVPVVCGGELTTPVARRWKTQINENAKLQAFFSELPEADHNEICGWAGRARGDQALGRHARGRRAAPAPAPALRADRRGDRRDRHRGGPGADRGRDPHGADDVGGDARRPGLGSARRRRSASTRCRSRRSTRSSRRWPVLGRRLGRSARRRSHQAQPAITAPA